MVNVGNSIAPVASGVLLSLLLMPGFAEEPESRAELEALQSGAIQGIVNRDVDRARSLAVELVRKSETLDDSRTATYLLAAAVILDAVGMSQQAHEILGRRRKLLEARVQVTPDYSLLASQLVAIQPLTQSAPGFHNNMQYELFTYYLNCLTSELDRKQSAEQQARQFEELLNEHELRLIEAGVSASVARLLAVGNWLLATQSQRMDDAEIWLLRLRPLFDSEEIAPKWKAFLWNRLAERSINRRQYARALDDCNNFSRFAGLSNALSRDPEAVVTCAEQFALIYLRMGDYAASRYLLQLTEEYERQNPNIDQANLWRVNMAKALEGDREFLLSRQLLMEALEHAGVNENFNLAMIINNLAINHYLTGELPEAHALMRQSQEMLKRIGADELQLAEAEINSGWLALADEQPATARMMFKQAQHLILRDPAAGRGHPRYAEALACEARAAAGLNENRAAIELVKEAESLAFAKLVDDLAGTGSARDRLAILQEARVHPESVAWPGVFDTFLELATDIGVSAAEQFEIVLKWKGVLNRFEQRNGDSPLAAELKQLNHRLGDLYFRPVSRLKRLQVRQEIELVENQMRSLERLMTSEIAADAERLAPPEVSELAARLDENSVFVDLLQVRRYQLPQRQGFIGASGEYVAFVIEPRGTVQRVPLGTADEVDAAVDRWRNHIVEEHPETRAAAKDVAQYLQKPLLPNFKSATNVIIRADGICHVVPWCALPGTDGKEYWIENLTFRTVHDLLPREARPVSDTVKLLLIGGVDYGPLADDWEALPGTMLEAKKVAEMFSIGIPRGSSNLLTAADANEATVLKQLAASSYVHLATHGFYLQQDSSNRFGLTTATTLLSSGLILAASPDREAMNQQLTAAEIRELDLAATELVVLSACESGLGKIKAGQGFDGLASSFHAAGANCVVSSLWKVPDVETTELISNFYHALWVDKQDPAAALRQAQLHMMRNTSLPAKARLPVSWAAFSASYASLAE